MEEYQGLVQVKTCDNEMGKLDTRVSAKELLG